MDLAKDILDVAEKVGQAPGLTLASSIVTSILKTVETSKNNTVRLHTLAHSLASQLIDISENMQGKWDDAPLTLKRAIDEYDAFLLEMLKSITRLSEYSRVRAFLLAGECEREITRLEKRVADVRSTITLMIGMNLSVVMNQVQISLASYGHVGRELHSGMQHLMAGERLLDLEPDSRQTMPDFSLFTREDFQVTKTIYCQATYDPQRRDVTTVNIHRAERCCNCRAILVKTFEGDDSWRVRNRFTKQLEIYRKALNPALLQIIGWSRATAQVPFHVYHAPGGVIEPFESWVKRTTHSNPVETIFGLYDMRNSIKELLKFGGSQRLAFGDLFFEAVVNIQQHCGRPRFSLIYTGQLFKRNISYKGSDGVACAAYRILSYGGVWICDEYSSDVLPAATLASMFAGGAKDWFGDPHGIDALFKGNYDTIDPLTLGPVLLEAGWLGTSIMGLKSQGSMRLGDVGYVAQDGNFEVVTNLHTRLVSRTGGLPGWTYGKFRSREAEPEDKFAVVTHSETLCPRYQHLLSPSPCIFSISHCYRAKYTDLDERHAWKTLHKEAFRVIEANHLSIGPHELKLYTSISRTLWSRIHRRHDWDGLMEPTGQEQFLPDPATVTIYEFQREGSRSVLDSGVPELSPQAFYSFRENINGLDPTKIHQHPETDLLMEQDSKRSCHIQYMQLPFGVTRPSGIEETPD